MAGGLITPSTAEAARATGGQVARRKLALPTSLVDAEVPPMAKRTCIAHPEQTVPCKTCADIAAISYDQTKPINDKTARYPQNTQFRRQ